MHNTHCPLPFLELYEFMQSYKSTREINPVDLQKRYPQIDIKEIPTNA